MGIHSQKDVERLIARLQERQEKLVAVMQGRETASLEKDKPKLYVIAEDIRFAVDDLATALKEIRTRLGKG